MNANLPFKNPEQLAQEQKDLVRELNRLQARLRADNLRWHALKDQLRVLSNGQHYNGAITVYKVRTTEVKKHVRKGHVAVRLNPR